MNLRPSNRKLHLLLAVLAAAGCALVGMYYGARQTGRVSLAEEVVLTLFTPVQGALGRLGFGMKERWQSLRHAGELQTENRRLRREVADLRARNARLQGYFAENKRLRRELQLGPRVPSEAVVAEVISLTTSNWVRRIRINRGTADLVQARDVVQSEAGLVGQVLHASRHTALVQLIIDRESGVAARVMRSRATGVVLGNSGKTCDLAYLERDADVVLGDVLITSGMGDVYPPGIVLGEVIAVHKDRYGARHTAVVMPATDFATLEEVFVMKARKEAE